jgi:ATP-dependent RNA helicase RhlE
MMSPAKEVSRTRTMEFDQLKLSKPLLRAIRGEGYATPTPIQVQTIPHLLKGRDLLGCAQTGTGKTAAFALPILHRLHLAAFEKKKTHPMRRGNRRISALILTPTRELAAQIGESFGAYGRHTGLRHTVIFGGVKQTRQVQALSKGVDILVATPGRLLDLAGQGVLNLGHVGILVLDEADRMLDMGFIHDIRRILKYLPDRRQNLLFSATMPKEIRVLADTILHKPINVKVAAETPAADTVEQAVYFVERPDKMPLLGHLLSSRKVTKALVFSRTKWGADKIARLLRRDDISASAIHSNKSQNARQRTLSEFKTGAIRVLVASDIAARGLDVDDISHVINFDLPHEPETYVHRIGRTGRAGATGKAVSFCGDEQRPLLAGIQKLLGVTIPVRHHKLAPRPATQGAPAHPKPKTSHGHASKARGSARPKRTRPKPHKSRHTPTGSQAAAKPSRRRRKRR